jgi:FkbM family methyltransferase
MLGGFLHLRDQQDFYPKTVIDVGAALGTFPLYEVFPEAKHFMIEPIAENEPYLAKLCTKLIDAEYTIAAAASKSGTATLTVNPDLVHSSVSELNENAIEPSAQNPYLRSVPAITLDQICQERGLEPPYLIKLDVDGNEPDVLAGASQILKETEYVIVEVTLFGQIHRVIDFMRSQNFVIYDMLDLAWRPSDGALWQADIAFVKENSRLRDNRTYITEGDNEAALDSHLQTYRNNSIAAIEQCNFHVNSQNQLQELDGDPRSVTELFHLRQTNLIAFPDWHQSDEQLSQTLVDLLTCVIRHPEPHQIALLIYIGTFDATEAELALSGAVMHLLTQRQPESLAGEPAVVLMGSLEQAQWQTLLPELSFRVALDVEDQAAIVQTGASGLPTI